MAISIPLNNYATKTTGTLSQSGGGIKGSQGRKNRLEHLTMF